MFYIVHFYTNYKHGLHEVLWYFGTWFGWCDRSLGLPGYLVVFGVLCSFIRFGDPPGGEVQKCVCVGGGGTPRPGRNPGGEPRV